MDLAKMLKKKNNLARLMKIADETREIEVNPVDVWKDDYNIKSLHKKVTKYLHSKLPKIKELEEEKEYLEKMLTGRCGRIEKLSIEEKLKFITQEIEKIRTSPERYHSLAKDFLKVYNGADEEYKSLKTMVISNYLEMIKEFYPHRIHRDFGPIDDEKCPYDGSYLNNYYGNEDGDDDKSICPTCNKIYNFATNQKVITTSKKKEYDPVGNFIKIMSHVEGEVSIEFPPKLWEDLDEKLVESGKTKEELKRRDIAHFLYASNNLTQFSLHLTAICKMYCDIPPPDFAEIRDKIIEDYRKFYEAYSSIEKDIESSLNSLYVLWKLLKRNRFSGNTDDFKPLISPTTLAKYESYYSAAIAKLGWDD